MPAITPGAGSGTGAPGPAGPSALIVTGLTGGTPGCLCYLVSAGVVRDLDTSMRGKLRDSVPLFFKHPTGTYYQLSPTGQIPSAGSGLTAPFAMVLKQKASPTDKNVSFYDTTNSTAYTAVQPSAFLSYLEAGRALNSSDVLMTFNGQGSIRFFDTSSLTPTLTQDKILVPGSYPNLGGNISTTKWAQPWNAFNNSNSYNQADTARSPSGGQLEFNANGGSLAVATNVAAGNILDGGWQGVLNKNDGNISDAYALSRVQGTGAAPKAVGVLIHFDNTTANRAFSVGYFNASTTWVDCTDPAIGKQFDAALAPGIGYRVVIDVIGNFVAAKIWQTNTTEPADYTVWGWQSTVTTTGGVGIASNGGGIAIGDFGAYTTAPASAPRGP